MASLSEPFESRTREVSVEVDALTTFMCHEIK